MVLKGYASIWADIIVFLHEDEKGIKRLYKGIDIANREASSERIFPLGASILKNLG